MLWTESERGKEISSRSRHFAAHESAMRGLVWTAGDGVTSVTSPGTSSSMPKDAYNDPLARKRAILRALFGGDERLRGGAIRHRAKAGNLQLRHVDDDLDEPPGIADFRRAASYCHDRGMLRYLETAWERWAATPEEERCRFFRRATSAASDASSSTPTPSDAIPALVPANYCARHDAITRPGANLHSQTCYYHTDDDTPIFEGLLGQLVADATVAVACAAHVVVQRERLARFDRTLNDDPVDAFYHYACVNHPGHHAGKSTMGGYCYVNNAAMIARVIQEHHTLRNPDRAKPVNVAILDVDYHAGNGTASIFWEDPTVFVASIHADPNGDYPWNACFEDDVGGGDGEGFTRCAPLPRRAGWDVYEPALAGSLDAIKAQRPFALIVSLGLDAHADDPVQEKATAGMELTVDDYFNVGRMIRETADAVDATVVFVQEGGYQVEVAGELVRTVFKGFEAGGVSIAG